MAPALEQMKPLTRISRELEHSQLPLTISAAKIYAALKKDMCLVPNVWNPIATVLSTGVDVNVGIFGWHQNPHFAESFLPQIEICTRNKSIHPFRELNREGGKLAPLLSSFLSSVCSPPWSATNSLHNPSLFTSSPSRGGGTSTCSSRTIPSSAIQPWLVMLSSVWALHQEGGCARHSASSFTWSTKATVCACY